MKRVALFGRPNVGKSTLFNRITRSRSAIVHRRPGSTRDGRSAEADWSGVRFLLLDTGGAGPEDAGPFAGEVRAAAEATAGDADVVVFVLDSRSGLTPLDEELAAALRRRPPGSALLVAANKAEGAHEATAAAEFAALGLGDVLPVSAEHGVGIGELLDRIVAALTDSGRPADSRPGEKGTSESGEPADPDASDAGRPLRIAIVGRANVGKSTLLNRLAGRERSLVSPVAGTTRDPVDELIRVNGASVLLVDTAGIRRARGRRGGAGFEEADALAVLLARRAIRRSDVCVVLFDAVRGPGAGDAAIARLAEDAGRGVVLAANRWDLVEGRERRWTALGREVATGLRHVAHAPLLRISARLGVGVSALPRAAIRVRGEHLRRIPTPELNDVLEEAARRYAPRSRRGTETRLLYAVQSGVAPPTFRIYMNASERELVGSYPRFLAGFLRRRYGFAGTPIRISIAPRERRSGG